MAVTLGVTCLSCPAYTVDPNAFRSTGPHVRRRNLLTAPPIDIIYTY